MKRLYLLLAGALLASSSVMAQEKRFPDDIQKCNILHCFCWTFNDIIAEMPDIAAAGFGAIQVSPMQGNCGLNASWYDAYMPYDIILRPNGNGTLKQLRSLVAEADKYGIKIIVDVVANHVNKAANYHDKWWDENGRVRWEGSINYNKRSSITHGQLGDYGDVNSEDPEVQARAVAYIERLKKEGVKGIRWDAAKHIGLPSEDCAFWSEVCGIADMWNYGELLDNPGGDKWTLLREYTDYIGVTDTEYSSKVRNNVRGGVAPTYAGEWTQHNIPADRIVLWGESHDNYVDFTNSWDQGRIDRAWAIGACRDKETSLYFSRPSATTKESIKMGVKGSTHFKDPEIAAVNNFRVDMIGRADAYSGAGGIAVVTREGGGAVVVYPRGGEAEVTAKNANSYCPEGEYYDVISGNKFIVTDTEIKGKTGPTGIVVLNALGSGIEGVEIDATDAVPEYYTLQGVKVAAPAPGAIYIVRRGTTVTKERF